MRGTRTPAASPAPPSPCCYLGLGVDEQDSVPIDGDEDDVRVGGLRSLLGRGSQRSQPGLGGHVGTFPRHMHAHTGTRVLPRPGRWPCPGRVFGARAGRSSSARTAGPGVAYLHLEEGRPECGPPADPLQEGHLGLLHCLVPVLVIGQEDVLGEARASEGLSGGQCPTNPSMGGSEVPAQSSSGWCPRPWAAWGGELQQTPSAHHGPPEGGGSLSGQQPRAPSPALAKNLFPLL